MTTVTGLTAERMLEIEGASVIDGEVVDENLILKKYDGTEINAGSVIGPPGPVGPQGPGSGTIPGEVRMWSGSALPSGASYGVWAWADGAVYPVATYPIAAGNIAASWRTFAGASDPGGANFRVPDLRGLTPTGLDGMPGGARANRMTRAVAITLAGRTGEETHIVNVNEMPSHAHSVYDPPHAHTIYDPGHVHGVGDPTHSHQNLFDDGQDHNWQNVIKEEYHSANVGQRYIYPAATGIWIGAAATGIAINGSGTGVGIYANGGGGAHENVQPTVFVPYIVCLKS
jgi:microcystin-dependent protein